MLSGIDSIKAGEMNLMDSRIDKLKEKKIAKIRRINILHNYLEDKSKELQ